MASNTFSNSHGKESSKHNHTKIPRPRMLKISPKKYCIEPFYAPVEPRKFRRQLELLRENKTSQPVAKWSFFSKSKRGKLKIDYSQSQV
jgi:hypothetical protein